MRRGRSTQPLTLSEDERKTLEQWVRSPGGGGGANRSVVRRGQNTRGRGWGIESVDTYGGKVAISSSWNIALPVWWMRHDLERPAQ